MAKTKSFRAQKAFGRTVIYVILGICTIVSILPFIWMLLTSVKSTAEAYRFPPTILPKKWLWTNYTTGLQKANFPLYFRNTFIVTILCTIGTVLSAQFVAYGFSRFHCRGSKLWYTLMLATMMLPNQVTLIPQYLLYLKMGMVDTYLPLVIPSWLGGGAFNIFLFIQFYRTLPKELDEAAFIDGASTFQTFIYIMMPSVKSVSLCVLVMSLVYNWNDFFTPLIYINSTNKFTLAIGLQFLNSAMGTTKIGQMMAVAVATMIPVLIIFFLCQKYFVEGIASTGVKG